MVEYLKKPFFIATFICVFLFYSGIIKISSNTSYNSLIPKNEIQQIQGIILNSPVKSSSGKTYSCSLELNYVLNKQNIVSNSKGNIKIFIPSELVEAYFPGKLYSSAQNKGAYIYEAGGEYLFKGKFTENGFVVNECLWNKWPKNNYGKIDYFRALCRLQFKRLMYSWGNAGGFLLALLCGAREYTEIETSNGFKMAGLSHILALSGMHLSMFSSIAIFIGSKVGRKKLTFIIRCITLVLFVWFAGFSPSLLRAFICSMLILLASVASVEQPDMIMILCFSFLLQCVISPEDILNAGFMLSYGALAGILLLNKFFFRILSKFIPGYFAASFSSSTSANLFTAPISIKIFGSFSPIGIVATTFISPLVTVFIYTGLIFIILSLIFPAIGATSGIFMNFQYTVIKKLVLLFAKVPQIIF